MEATAPSGTRHHASRSIFPAPDPRPGPGSCSGRMCRLSHRRGHPSDRSPLAPRTSGDPHASGRGSTLPNPHTPSHRRLPSGGSRRPRRHRTADGPARRLHTPRFPLDPHHCANAHPANRTSASASADGDLQCPHLQPGLRPPIPPRRWRPKFTLSRQLATGRAHPSQAASLAPALAAGIAATARALAAGTGRNRPPAPPHDPPRRPSHHLRIVWPACHRHRLAWRIDGRSAGDRTAHVVTDADPLRLGRTPPSRIRRKPKIRQPPPTPIESDSACAH